MYLLYFNATIICYRYSDLITGSIKLVNVIYHFLRMFTGPNRYFDPLLVIMCSSTHYHVTFAWFGNAGMGGSSVEVEARICQRERWVDSLIKGHRFIEYASAWGCQRRRGYSEKVCKVMIKPRNVLSDIDNKHGLCNYLLRSVEIVEFYFSRLKSEFGCWDFGRVESGNYVFL